jgi:hypothetical protein
MAKQSTSCVVMTPPDHFGFNPQTANTNPFQHTPKVVDKSPEEICTTALQEFQAMVKKLEDHGISVLILPSRTDEKTPDAVFPNNWFSTHEDGKIVFYPLLTSNRRLERQKEMLLDLLKLVGITQPEIIDLTLDEEKNLILESTGSMILDREHKLAFAMASPRTIQKEFEKWCKLMNYDGIFIKSSKKYEKEVYHTNINMCIGTEFVVICMDVVATEKEKNALRQKFKSLGKDCIEISLDQVYNFCGNILELQSKNGEKFLAMSETAYQAFSRVQRERLGKYARLLQFAIPTIEEIGGGGVRCMLGEIFMPQSSR